MTVYESDLPGVGKKFEVELDDDERLVVVIHNTGKREVFRRAGDESVKLFELTDQLSRQLGSILEGAYFQPVTTDKTETVLDEDTLLEWVKVVEGSDVAGRTLGELDFRNRTGATVVAVQREEEGTDSNPGPETTVRADDTLIVLGPREACRTAASLASGAPGAELESLEAAGEGADDGESGA